MAKIDDVLAEVSNCFTNPNVQFGYTMMPDNMMENYGLRRKGKAESYKVTFLALGEMGVNPIATFYGYRLTDCLKKALEWRGMATKSKRGQGRAQGAAQ